MGEKTVLLDDIVVKEEHEDPSEDEGDYHLQLQVDAEEEDYLLQVDTELTLKNEVKTEAEAPPVEKEFTGRTRRSQRLQQQQQGDPEKAKKPSTAEAYREKMKRKYERKKQKVAEMTEEERAILREKQRISHLKRRQKLREEGRVPKRQPNNYSKSSVSKNAASSNRQQLSEEEMNRKKRELRLKNRFNYLVKEALMTEEEREQQRLKRYLQAQAWKSSKSKEEMQEMKAKRNERFKRKLQEDEEFRQHISQRNRNWRQNLTEEKRKKYMGSVKNAVKKYLKNLKVKNPEMYNKNYEKIKAKLRQKTATETPEQRQKRLQRYKINAARTKLKKQLEGEGLAPEVIQTRVDALVEEMKSQPLPPPSEYKPRPRKTGGVKVKKTEEEEEVLHADDGNEFVCNDVVVVDDEHSSNITYTYHFALNTLGTEEEMRTVVEMESNLFIPVAVVDHNDDISPPPSSPHEPIVTKPSPSPPPPLPSSPSSSPGPLSFKCPQCPQVLDSDPALRNHLNTFHLHTCWKCPKCYKVMLSPTELFEHFKSHQNLSERKKSSESSEMVKSEAKFICMRCPYISNEQRNNKFETMLALRGHVKRKHPESFWPCRRCKILKYSKDRLQFHRKSCSAKL